MESPTLTLLLGPVASETLADDLRAEGLDVTAVEVPDDDPVALREAVAAVTTEAVVFVRRASTTADHVRRAIAWVAGLGLETPAGLPVRLDPSDDTYIDALLAAGHPAELVRLAGYYRAVPSAEWADVVDDGRTLRLGLRWRWGGSATAEHADRTLAVALVGRRGTTHVPTRCVERVAAGGTVAWSAYVADIPVARLSGRDRLVLDLAPGTDGPRMDLEPTTGLLASARRMRADGLDLEIAPNADDDQVLVHAVRHRAGLASLRWLATHLRQDAASLLRLRRFTWVRAARVLTRPLVGRRPIWLVGEREDTARDNGYHFFAHLCRTQPDAQVYYVIQGGSEQRAKVEALGPVLVHSSRKHRLLMLHAEVLANAYSVKHMLPRQWHPGAYLKQAAWRLGARRVYLKHGVNDKVNMLKRGTGGYDLYLTVGPGESGAVRAVSGYDEQVAETGLPRFDALTRLDDGTSDTVVLFMPTWRRAFVPKLFSDEDVAAMSFEGSSYQRFVTDFLADPRLAAMLAEHGARLQFLPHYNMGRLLEGLDVVDGVELVDSATPHIQELMRRCDLFLTDYSSVHFDIAYLGTPLLYTHFDEAEYLEGHASPSWFDHERDGFGPVVRTVDETLEALGRYLASGCVREEFYEERVKAVFTHQDRENGARVVRAVEEMVRRTAV